MSDLIVCAGQVDDSAAGHPTLTWQKPVKAGTHPISTGKQAVGLCGGEGGLQSLQAPQLSHKQPSLELCPSWSVSDVLLGR